MFWEKNMRSGAADFTAGHYAEAAAFFHAALAEARAVGPSDPRQIESLYELARAHVALGDVSTAERHFADYLHLKRESLGQDHLDVLNTLDHLVVLYESRASAEGVSAADQRAALQAASWHQESALEIRKRTLGPDHPDSIASLEKLATLYHRLNERDRAQRAYESLLAIKRKVYGPNELVNADILDRQVELYEDEPPDARVEELLQQALSIRENALGPDHLEVARTLLRLAAVVEQCYASDNEEVMERRIILYRRASTIFEKSLGPDHLDVASCLDTLASIHAERSEDDEDEDENTATALYERALAIRKKNLGPDHPDVARSISRLDEVNVGRLSAARYARALATHDSTPGGCLSEDAALSMRQTLASIYYKAKEYAKAEPLFEGLLEYGAQRAHAGCCLICWARNPAERLGEVYYAQNKLEEAKRHCEYWLAQFEVEGSIDDPTVCRLREILVEIYERQNELGRLTALLERLLPIFVQPPRDNLLVSCTKILAKCYMKRGNVKETESLYEWAFAHVNKRLCQRDITSASQLAEDYAMFLESLGRAKDAARQRERARDFGQP